MKKSVILASLLSAVFGSAQVDTTRVRDIDEVTVSASKKLQKLVDVPATVNIITAKDISSLPVLMWGNLLQGKKVLIL